MQFTEQTFMLLNRVKMLHKKTKKLRLSVLTCVLTAPVSGSTAVTEPRFWALLPPPSHTRRLLSLPPRELTVKHSVADTRGTGSSLSRPHIPPEVSRSNTCTRHSRSVSKNHHSWFSCVRSLRATRGHPRLFLAQVEGYHRCYNLISYVNQDAGEEANIF